MRSRTLASEPAAQPVLGEAALEAQGGEEITASAISMAKCLLCWQPRSKCQQRAATGTSGLVHSSSSHTDCSGGSWALLALGGIFSCGWKVWDPRRTRERPGLARLKASENLSVARMFSESGICSFKFSCETNVLFVFC